LCHSTFEACYIFWVLGILPFVYNCLKKNGCPLWRKEEVIVFGN
jgi:hypothetical protein